MYCALKGTILRQGRRGHLLTRPILSHACARAPLAMVMLK